MALSAGLEGATELDITSLLQPRQGYLSKLGGGQEKGSKWNRRWFVLRDNILMYFNSPKDFTGFRDKPSGVVLLEECNVRTRDERGAPTTRPFTFVISHANGESVVLAADSENEMLEWMQAVRTSRMCITDSDAISMSEVRRRDTAEAELTNAMSRRADADAELAAIEEEWQSVQSEHHKVEMEKEKAEKELKELMARFKLRKSLLHWRHRKLTLSFRALITIVFRERIDGAKSTKGKSDLQAAMMQDEMDITVAARQKAEAAKRKSEEMLAKELALKKEGELDARECEKTFAAESQRTYTVSQDESQLLSEGAGDCRADTKEKEEVLALALQLANLKAESELVQQQLKRRAPGLSAASGAEH